MEGATGQPHVSSFAAGAACSCCSLRSLTGSRRSHDGAVRLHADPERALPEALTPMLGVLFGSRGHDGRAEGAALQQGGRVRAEGRVNWQASRWQRNVAVAVTSTARPPPQILTV